MTRIPPNDTDIVLVQIAGDNGGFVSEYERAHRSRLSAAQKQEVMAYHGVDSLWALHQLGRTFAVCDGWFCSVPGPTWTNRLFAMSGTSQGRVKMPEGIFQPNLHRYDQPSVFLRLEQARPRRSLRIYFGDFPLSLLLADRRRVSSVRKYRDLETFFDAAGREVDDFPDFALIEPRYLNDPPKAPALSKAARRNRLMSASSVPHAEMTTSACGPQGLEEADPGQC